MWIWIRIKIITAGSNHGNSRRNTGTGTYLYAFFYETNLRTHFYTFTHIALSTLRFKSFSTYHSPPSQDSLISYGSYLGERLRGVPVGGGEGYKTLDQSVPLNNITVLIHTRALIISTILCNPSYATNYSQ